MKKNYCHSAKLLLSLAALGAFSLFPCTISCAAPLAVSVSETPHPLSDSKIQSSALHTEMQNVHLDGRTKDPHLNFASQNFILTAETMHSYACFSLKDALELLPGVEVLPDNLNTGHDIVQIHGNERVGIFIDGIPYNQAAGIIGSHGTYDLQYAPPLKSIDRIELNYSADNLNAAACPGGSINIISKKGDKKETSFRGARGPYDAWRWDLLLSRKGHGWNFIGSGGRSNIDAIHYKSSTGKHSLPNSLYNRREMFYRIDKRIDDNSSLFFTYGHMSNDRDVWFKRSHPANRNSEKLVNNFALHYNYKETSSPARVTIYHNYTQGDNYIPTIYEKQEDEPSFSRQKSFVNGISWQDASYLKNVKITGGADFFRTSVKNSSNNILDPDSLGNNYEKHRNTAALWFNAEKDFSKLNLQLRGEILHNSGFGEKLNGKLLGSYAPDTKSSIYLSGGNVYVLPGLDALYANNRLLSPNPELTEEKGYSINFGGKRQLSPNTLLALHGNIEHIKDPLFLNKNTDNRLQTINADKKYKKESITLYLNHKFSSKYSSDLSWTYTHKNKPGNFTPLIYSTEKDIAKLLSYSLQQALISEKYTAPHNLKASLRYKDANLNGYLRFKLLSGQDERFLRKNSVTVGAGINYKMNRHMSLFAKAENLFNAKTELLPSFPQGEIPGRGRYALMGFTYEY